MSESRPANQTEHGADQLARTGRSFLALGAGNYGAMVIALGTNALLARRLGPEQFGHLALLLMASQVLLLAAVNWSHAGFVRFGAREFATRGEVSETLWARLGIVWPVAALGLIGVAIFREALAGYLNIPTMAVWLLLAHFAAICALSVIGAVFQARDQMARYGACLLLDKAAMLGCVLVLPAAWTGTALNTLMCYAASSVAVAVWGIGVLGVRQLRPVWPTRAAYRSMLQFSVPLLLTSWAGFFGTNWFDLVVLKWYVPLAGIGMYSLASQLAGVVQQITVIFATLLLPELSVMVLQGQHDRIRTLMERVLPYWLLGTSVLFTLVLLGSRVGLPLVFGPSYAGAAPVLALLMVASCALALFNSCTSLVGAFGATWVLTGISFVSTAVNVAMNLVLIPKFGITGSAMATVLAYLTGGVLILAFVQHRVGGKIVRLAWFTTPVMLAYGCFAVFESWWFYPAVVVLGSLNVMALVMVFKLFHAEDAAFFRGLHLRLPFGLGAGASAGRSL